MANDKQHRADFFKSFRAQHPEPYFHFTNLPPSKRLDYEMLDASNYMEILQMFEKDDSPFISSQYRDKAELEEYLAYHLNYQRYSPKRGGCDWLVRLKGEGSYIGLLHLYDLSKETFNDYHRKCTIGFLTAKPFRRKGYTSEAVNNLTQYIFGHFEMDRILAYTEKNNQVSKTLLEKLNFIQNNEAYFYKNRYDYFELRGTDKKK